MLPALPVQTWCGRQLSLKKDLLMMWLRQLMGVGALWLLCWHLATAQAPAPNLSANRFATGSVLSSGEWYKVAVTQSGIYKIDKSVLQALGVNTQNLNPSKLQLFGNGGGMLPQPNSAPRPDDLQENAIMVTGEADGRFDDGDYILFYAQGPHTWSYNEAEQRFQHQYNLYSDTAFYFLRVNHSQGTRITSRGQESGTAQTISTYNARAFHEQDLKNMVFSGREWYGEEFNSFQSSRQVSFPVTGAVPGTQVKLTAALMANSATDCSFTLSLNGQALGTQLIPNRGTYNYHPLGVDRVKTYTLSASANTSEYSIKLDFSGSATSIGYLNYLTLNYERQLKLYGEQTAFRSVQSTQQAISRFSIAALPAGASVWDVTTPGQPVQQQHSNGSFTTATSALREFVVFENISSKPIPKGRVANQNLHSLGSGIDLVIVSYPGFMEAANRLAAHRAQQSGLQVQVVTTTQVYNEFSSGAQDVTAIRDFMRMLYSRSNKPAGEIMYLLLFGDASYDYKSRIRNNTNFVPVYESRESLHPILSYSSEDYFGFLDEEEGEWAENSAGDHLLDIGIGRLPAKTLQEAHTLVDKIISYESPSHFGNWRSRITFVADDGDYNEHQNDAEALANYLEENHPQYDANKVYLDLYPQQAVASGQRVPAAASSLDQAFEQGSLIINYTGHGNEVSWAQEQVLTLPQISSYSNSNNLPFLLTATCEFGRYDDPSRPSGAELALLHPSGGAIGLITTTRPVYSNGNRVLNRNFYKSAFTPINGHMPRLGDLVLLTKNNSVKDNLSGSTGVNNRNFSLLSDPSMQLAYPHLQAMLTSISSNGSQTDTLRAMGKISLEGQVQHPDGSIAEDFDGTLRLKVYDKPNTLQTLGDEGAQQVQVKVQQQVLYDGSATVRNGLFALSFVVPKDINYTYGHGKISLYASSGSHDAMGATRSVAVGGTATDAPADNLPPSLSLYMDDESFKPGGLTGTTTTLLAKLFDDSGINTTGTGIGHDITAVLDEDPDNLLVLNSYYTSTPDTYMQGELKYTFKDLTPGPHSLRLKAWDTHNNSAEGYIEFFVSNDAQLALEHILNFPNPFSGSTTFQIDHNRAGQDLVIQVQIYNAAGKLVKSLQTTSKGSPTRITDLTWDGRDEYNELLARGVYMYSVTVRSMQDGAKASKFEKLVILN